MQHLLLYLYYHWSRKTIEPYKYYRIQTNTYTKTQTNRQDETVVASRKEETKTETTIKYLPTIFVCILHNNRICSRSEAKTKRDFLLIICFVMHLTSIVFNFANAYSQKEILHITQEETALALPRVISFKKKTISHKYTQKHIKSFIYRW